MNVKKTGQTFYEREAEILFPHGCIALVNEHGACMSRGCGYCFVYYDGPSIITELDDSIEDLEDKLKTLRLEHLI